MIRLSRFGLHAVIVFVVLWTVLLVTLVAHLPVLEFILALLFHGGFAVAALVVSSSLHRLHAVTFLVLVVTLLVSFPVASFADAVLVVTPFLLGVPVGLGLRRVVGDFVDRRRDETVRADARGRDLSGPGVLPGGGLALPYDRNRLLGLGRDEGAHDDVVPDTQGRPTGRGGPGGTLRDVPRADRRPAPLQQVPLHPVRPVHPDRED
jgi:hypothetical protein